MSEPTNDDLGLTFMEARLRTLFGVVVRPSLIKQALRDSPRRRQGAGEEGGGDQVPLQRRRAALHHATWTRTKRSPSSSSGCTAASTATRGTSSTSRRRPTRRRRPCAPSSSPPATRRAGRRACAPTRAPRTSRRSCSIDRHCDPTRPETLRRGSVITGPSVRNCRIEGLWTFIKDKVTKKFRLVFLGVRKRHLFDPTLLVIEHADRRRHERAEQAGLAAWTERAPASSRQARSLADGDITRSLYGPAASPRRRRRRAGGGGGSVGGLLLLLGWNLPSSVVSRPPSPFH